MPSAPGPTRTARWQALRAAALSAFHRYASWLVGITWKRFILLSILLLIVAAITQQLPIFHYTVSERVQVPIELPELAQWISNP